MGILDDAIREHLELKKAHGAPDEEIRGKETEAFGPIRQEVAAEPAGDETALLQPADLEPAPAVPDPDVDAEPVAQDPAWGDDTELFAEEAVLEPDAVLEPEPAVDVPAAHHPEERHPALHDTDEHLRGHEHAPDPVFHHQAEEAPVEPEPAPLPDPPIVDPPVGEPPVAGEEDVLEETPEFLQDAPEHDRLWFEQKPPRDFDFGE